ncbi:unnamed protein product, partial [Owenia fusiformis]
MNMTGPHKPGAIRITIVCSDLAIPSYSITREFTLYVLESENTPRGILFNGNGFVKENIEGAFLGNVSIVDLVSGMVLKQDYRFSITDDTLPFTMDEHTLKTKEGLDYEQERIWFIVIQTTLLNDEVIQEDVMIHVLDTNDASTAIGLYHPAIIYENSPDGTFLNEMFTEDQDLGQDHVYTILHIYGKAKNGTIYQIHIDTLSIADNTLNIGTNNKEIDFEAYEYITVEVNTTDVGHFDGTAYSFIENITLDVIDVNEAPIDIATNITEVNENITLGTIIGELTIEDPDINDDHTCNITTASNFKIVDKTMIQVWRELDFEMSQVEMFIVICFDFGGLSMDKVLQINVFDINEPPFNITLSNSNIDENNMPGQTVGELKAMDFENSMVMFMVASEGHFAIVGDGTLVANETLHHNKAPGYNINVTAIDHLGLSTSKNFYIKVNAIDLPPKGILL